MAAVPQLRGDEDVLTLKARNLSKGSLDALANLTLVAVDLGKIQVAVTSLEGLIDTSANLAGGGLPGAVAKGRDLGASVESDGATGRHVERWDSIRFN